MNDYITNKKVLLRECKRHTACRVVSTPSVVLTGYPPRPDLVGGGTPWRVCTLPGYPCPGLVGYPVGGVPCWGVTLLGEYPVQGEVPCWGVLGGTLPGYPYPDLARGTLQGVPCWGVPYLGTPILTVGYPGRVPPSRVPSVLTWQGTPPSWTWLGTPPGVCPMAFWVMLQSIMGYGYLPLMDRQKDRHVSKHYLPVVLRTRAVINS